jgi:hypothetical protein
VLREALVYSGLKPLYGGCGPVGDVSPSHHNDHKGERLRERFNRIRRIGRSIALGLGKADVNQLLAQSFAFYAHGTLFLSVRVRRSHSRHVLELFLPCA